MRLDGLAPLNAEVYLSILSLEKVRLLIDHTRIHFFGDILRVQAEVRPDAVALEGPTGTLTYSQLEMEVREATDAIANCGVRQGDRVSWLGMNGIGWFQVFFGALALRACFVPLNFRLSPAELATILEDSGAKTLFVAEEMYPVARATVAAMSRPPRIITVGWDHPDHPRMRPEGARDALPPRSEDDILLLYTSGTTGQPKGVRLTNRNYAKFLEISAKVDGFDYDTADTVLIVMPLFHVAGVNVSLAGLAHGCRVILASRFVPGDTLRTIEKKKVAQIFLAPPLIQMLLQAPEIEGADLSSLKTIGYGASPISEAVLAAMKDRVGCQFTQFYGMTESSGSGTYLAPGQHRPELLRSCGQAWPGIEATVLTPSGGQAAPGEVGEIVIRGDTVTPGYWQNDEATAAAIRGGWLHTGDAGYLDEEGRIYVHDRIKDMIISGGENVYPAEVENAIFGCPGVRDVAVIGVPSDRWGEEVKAIVVANEDAQDPTAVIEWTRSRIAGYKVPKSVDFLDELPRNASGKVLRKTLRDRYWTGRERLIV